MKRLKGLEPSTFCMASSSKDGSKSGDLQVELGFAAILRRARKGRDLRRLSGASDHLETSKPEVEGFPEDTFDGAPGLTRSGLVLFRAPGLRWPGRAPA